MLFRSPCSRESQSRGCPCSRESPCREGGRAIKSTVREFKITEAIRIMLQHLFRPVAVIHLDVTLTEYRCHSQFPKLRYQKIEFSEMTDLNILKCLF